jgi:hypothetical protein
VADSTIENLPEGNPHQAADNQLRNCDQLWQVLVVDGLF